MAKTFKDVVSDYKREQDRLLSDKNKDPEKVEKELESLLYKTLDSLNDIFNQMSREHHEYYETVRSMNKDARHKLFETYLKRSKGPDSKVYDSFTGMMVEKGQESEFQKAYDSVKAKDKVYSVGYKATESGPFQSIGVVANSESEALQKFKKHKPDVFKVFGASSNSESLETMKMKGKPIIDEAIEKLKSNDSNGYYVNGYYIFWNKRTGLWEVSKNGQVKFTTYSENDAVEWAKKH